MAIHDARLFGELWDVKDPGCLSSKTKCYGNLTTPGTAFNRPGKWKDWLPDGSLPWRLSTDQLTGNNQVVNANPISLVTGFNQNKPDMDEKMMNNVDNFVGYIWNRFMDHHYLKLDVNSAP